MHGTFSQGRSASTWRGPAAAAGLAGLVALGGGGSPAPISELACELLAVAVLAAWLVLSPKAGNERPAGLRAITLLALATPVVQLIPLPPAIWQALPGRENLVAALGLVGFADGWRSFSIAPHRTLAALLALGPPLVVLWLAALAVRREVNLLLTATALVSLLAVCVGAGQLAQGGGGWLDFYRSGDTGIIHGFSANRNTAADIFLIGIVALAAVWKAYPGLQTPTGTAAMAGAGALLMLGVLLTGSRTGIGMIPLAAGFAIASIRADRGHARSIWLYGWRAGVGLLGLGAAAALAVWWARTVPAIAAILVRFDFVGEFRPELWRDARFAAQGYWPFGSGLGTFHPAMLPAERLEVVDRTLPNRAHNELLELAIEGGVPLLACWLAIVAIVAWRLRRALAPESTLPRSQGMFCAAVLMIAALHSLVDYPLRSVAMASLVAMAAGIVLSAKTRT